MLLFAWTALSGWTAAFLLAAGIAIPWLAARPKKLAPHYWAGFLIVGAALFHAYVPMSAGRISGYDQPGLWLAAGALLLMFWQAGLGLALRASAGLARISARKTHFWTMLGIVALVAAHVARNRP